MGFRRFADRDKHTWEIRPVSTREWEFAPAGDNPGRPRSVAAPGYERDPFELSQEELQRLLDQGKEAPPRQVRSPFKE